MNVSDTQIKSALDALVKVLSAKQRKELWDEGEKMFLQVNLHKIPTLPNERPTRLFVELEHSLWSEQTSICLLVKDSATKDQEDSIEAAQATLKAANVTNVNKIIPYDQLKKEYKGHELKRYLAKDYDVFMADSAINRHALSHLGTEFFRRRKVPLSVDMDKKDTLKENAEIEKHSKSTQVIVTPRGANINVAFAHSLMSEDEKLDNLKKLVNSLGGVIPRGVANIKALCLQGTGTIAIPLYRNDTVAEGLDELCGLELERKAKHEQIMEMRGEIKKKTKRPLKKKRAKGAQKKKSSAKRKLLKEPEQEGAKKAKVES